jgi:hypothetical protein
MKFNITAGVIERARQVSFERLLWRVSKGNVFVRFADVEEEMQGRRKTKKRAKFEQIRAVADHLFIHDFRENLCRCQASQGLNKKGRSFLPKALELLFIQQPP